MSLRKFSGILIACVFLIASTITACADSTTFPDIQKHWAKSDIQSLIDKGAIKGYGDGTFRPNNNITRAEFTTIALKALDPDGKKIKAAVDNASTKGTATLEQVGANRWDASTVVAANYYGLKALCGTSTAEWEKPITRAEMAFVSVTLAKEIGNQSLETKDKIENNIADYTAVANNTYKDAILKAYSSGILSGTDSKGTFNPIGTATRAESCTIIVRIIDPSTRAKVEVKAPEVVPPAEQPADKEGMYKILPDRSNTSPTVGYQDIGLPYEGAINPHTGKAITRDPASGVLGFGNGQKGGIYLGLKYADGFAIKVNSDPGFVYDLAVGLYQEKGGYTFFEDEWIKILGVAEDKIIADGYKNSAGVFATDKAKEGMMADMYGNITTNASEAFFKVKDGMWVDQK